jgi:hypothetical protein
MHGIVIEDQKYGKFLLQFDNGFNVLNAFIRRY